MMFPYHIEASPLSEQARAAADQWYADNKVSPTQLMTRRGNEIAAYLNKAVYAHCVNGSNNAQINKLFQTCETTCFGYAYVLRGLLENLGYQTRFVHLHNIPQQGNHTAMEVLIDEKWRFFDPTFGVYFTNNGRADGEILSLNDIIKNDLPTLNKKFRPRKKQSHNFSPQRKNSIMRLISKH